MNHLETTSNSRSDYERQESKDSHDEEQHAQSLAKPKSKEFEKPKDGFEDEKSESQDDGDNQFNHA